MKKLWKCGTISDNFFSGDKTKENVSKIQEGSALFMDDFHRVKMTDIEK